MQEIIHIQSNSNNKQHNLQSQKHIINSLRYKIKCCRDNPAYLTCISRQCQKISLMCQDQQCQCNKNSLNHKKCTLIKVENIISGIQKNKFELTKQNIKYYQTIIDKINSLLDQLSKVKEKFQIEQELFGLNEKQIQLIFLVNQNKMNCFTGKFFYSLRNNYNKSIPLSIQQSLIKNQLQIRQASFKAISQSFETLLYNNIKIQNNFQLFQLPLKTQSLLKGTKIINITPNQNSFSFLNQKSYICKKNNKICYTRDNSFIFSNEQLPFNNKNVEQFYFQINGNHLFSNNWLQIGISFPDDIKHEDQKFYNRVGYNLCLQKVIKYNHQDKFQKVYHSMKKDNPFQVICLISKKQKNLSIIYNNQVQMKIQLDKNMLNEKRKCYAYAWILNKCKAQFI